MKRHLSYQEMIELIPIEKLRGYQFDEVVAVMRGGMTAAHYIAKELQLKCGAYFPASKDFDHDRLILANPSSKKILFVEDLIAQGRTLMRLKKFMTNFKVEWMFYPVIVSHDYTSDEAEYIDVGQQFEEWIVFPYEDFDKMKEGDRGLFREGSDRYGK